MNCNNCGKKLTKKQNFCDNCGTTVPVMPKEDNKRTISIILSIVLAISLVINTIFIFNTLIDVFSSEKIEGNGFDSPKESIVAYVEAFTRGDVEEMISTFAIETYIQNFQFEEYIELKSFYDFYNSQISFPNDSQFKTEINKQTLQSYLVRNFKSTYFTLTNVDNSIAVISFTRENKQDDIEDFINSLKDPDFDKKISKIKILSVLDKEDFNYNIDIYDGSFEMYSSYIDADEFCDIAVEIEYQGERYYMFMLTAKFDGKWYNISPISQLGLLCGMDASSGGIMAKTS